MNITHDDQPKPAGSTQMANISEYSAQAAELWDLAVSPQEWEFMKAALASKRNEKPDGDDYYLLVIAGDCEPAEWVGPYSWDILMEVAGLIREHDDDDGLYWCFSPYIRPVDVCAFDGVDLVLASVPDDETEPEND